MNFDVNDVAKARNPFFINNCDDNGQNLFQIIENSEEKYKIELQKSLRNISKQNRITD